jgi:hypothetical protein
LSGRPPWVKATTTRKASDVRRVLLLCAVAGLGINTARAAQQRPPQQPVDAELLEFLGSLDSEEDGWQEYLEKVPVKAEAKLPVKAPQTPAKPAEKQVKAK